MPEGGVLEDDAGPDAAALDDEAVACEEESDSSSISSLASRKSVSGGSYRTEAEVENIDASARIPFTAAVNGFCTVLLTPIASLDIASCVSARVMGRAGGGMDNARLKASFFDGEWSFVARAATNGRVACVGGAVGECRKSKAFFVLVRKDHMPDARDLREEREVARRRSVEVGSGGGGGGASTMGVGGGGDTDGGEGGGGG